MNLEPWHVHPALTAARLDEVGRLLWKARVSAAESAIWAEGDDLWNIGCTAFKRSLTSITRAAAGLAGEAPLPYLTIKDGSMKFRFAIGGVPIRFYRGDANGEAPLRYAVPDLVEEAEHQFAFKLFDTPTPTGIFRMVVETDRKGFPTSVQLVQVDKDGSILGRYRLNARPDEGEGGMHELRHRPVTPPPAPIGTVVEVDETVAKTDTERRGA